MSTYKQFENYIKSNYELIEDDAPEGFMALGFNLPEGRSQIIVVGEGNKSDLFGETAEVMSFIGALKSTKLSEALKDVFYLPLGGLTMVGDQLMLRHTILLDNVDENEIDVPLYAVAFGADVLEQKFSGGDRL